MFFFNLIFPKITKFCFQKSKLETIKLSLRSCVFSYVVHIAFNSSVHWSLTIKLEINFLQSELDNIKAEFEKLKDSSLHQRKKMTEIMASLMKDMSEIGSVVGGNANEFKVRSENDNCMTGSTHGHIYLYHTVLSFTVLDWKTWKLDITCIF